MNVYHYHPVTGEYLRESEANDDPKETASAGEFVPKVPAHATLVAPPGEVAGYARVFDSGSWSQVEDHRGETHYSTSTGEAVIITDLGSIPSGLTNTAPGENETWDEIAEEWVADIDAEIAAIEAQYAPQFAALDVALLNVLWADGPNETAGRAALAAQREALLADKELEILTLLM